MDIPLNEKQAAMLLEAAVRWHAAVTCIVSSSLAESWGLDDSLPDPNVFLNEGNVLDWKRWRAYMLKLASASAKLLRDHNIDPTLN